MSNKTPKTKFYAVKKGFKTGIFNTWAECKEYTDYYSDNKFQSFDCLAEAQKYMGIDVKTTSGPIDAFISIKMKESKPPIPPVMENIEKSFIAKKIRKEYPLNDAIHNERIFYGNIHTKLLSNERGMFMDIREYKMNKPTTKGVRMPIEEFKLLAEWGLKTARDYQEGDK